MSVLNDYKCKMHGVFESFERRCPYGCSRAFVSLIFNKAPAFGSQRTSNIDRELKLLAQDYNLPDIRNDKDGTSTMTKLGRDGKKSNWIDVQHAKPGFSQREGEKAPVFDIRAAGADADARPAFKPGDFAMPAAIIEGKHRP